MPNTAEFPQWIAAQGYISPPHIVPGKIYPIPAHGKGNRNQSARVMLFPDMRGGWLKDFTIDQTYIWQSKDKPRLSRAEVRKVKREAAERARVAKIKEARRHEIAANECTCNFHRGDSADGFSYLHEKQAENIADRCRTYRGQLMIPLESAEPCGDSLITSIQYIWPNGKKKFHPGSNTKGVYFVAQAPENHTHIVICEGAATAATLAAMDATALVIAAMNTGNIVRVARVIRDNHPDDRIIIAGDDDRDTEKRIGINPGRTKAIEAARAIGAEYAIPEFPPGVEGTDYNDLMRVVLS